MMAAAPESSLVSVDVVVLRQVGESPMPMLAVIERDREPFLGEPALPGVLLGRGERLSAAGARAIGGKVGIAPDDILAMGQLATFDEPLRDPRGPTLSVALWAVVRAAPPPALVPLDDVPALAFDHNRILDDCRPRLGDMLWRDVTFTRSLIGEQFTLARAAALTQALTGQRPDPGNLNRLLRKTPALRREDEGARLATGGRPAAWWVWVDAE